LAPGCGSGGGGGTPPAMAGAPGCPGGGGIGMGIGMPGTPTAGIEGLERNVEVKNGEGKD